VKRIRPVVMLVLLALVATACGARVSDEQVAEVRSSGEGASQGTGGGDSTGNGDGLAVGEGGGSTSAGAVGGGAATAGGGEAGGGDAATGGDAGGGAAGGGDGGGDGGGQAAAPPPPEGGNGGATDVGVTETEMVLGNVSTLSGPVPGLFQGAVIGSQAVVAYQNSLGGMFGRKFKLDVRDDQLDTGQNRSHTIDLTKKAFAFIGSFSLFDDAAVEQIKASGMPDITYSLNSARRGLPNNFSVEPAPPRGAPTGGFNYFKKKFPGAIKAVGTIYTELAKGSHEDYKKAAESVGYDYAYERAIQATETDFTADIVSMRQRGVKFVFLVAVDEKTTARIAKAMAQQSFKPEVFMVHGAAYHPGLVPLAGAAVEGMFNAQPYSMFAGEDAAHIPEVKLFNEWVQKVKPGYKPDLFAAFAWSSGRLFFQALEKAGPKATRADVINALKTIDDFSANGMLAPAGPASKRPPVCYIVTQVKGGKFQRVDSPPPGYRCDDGKYLVL